MLLTVVVQLFADEERCVFAVVDRRHCILRNVRHGRRRWRWRRRRRWRWRRTVKIFTFVEVAGERKVFWVTFFVRPNGPVRMDDAETTADDKRETKRRCERHRAAVDGERRIVGKKNSEFFILLYLSVLSYGESGTSHVASVGYVSRRRTENVPLSPLLCG